MFNNPALINPYQPERTRHHESGKVLMYRTRPKWGKQMIQLHTQANQVCMMSLYRAVRAGEVPVQVAIQDLYNWIGRGHFSKRNLGAVVVNAVIYEPRVLLNRKDTGAMMTYSFGDLRELEYGLEWMICIWLRRFLNQTSGDDETIKTKTQMAEELDMLANASEDEYFDVYVRDLATWKMPAIDWNELSLEQNFDFREELPKPKAPPEPKPERRIPRDLSKPF